MKTVWVIAVLSIGIHAIEVGVSADGQQRQLQPSTGTKLRSDGGIAWNDASIHDDPLLTVRVSCSDESTSPPTKFRWDSDIVICYSALSRETSDGRV
jgi:hypothetical protein